MTASTLLEVAQLTVRFGGVTALKAVDLTVAKGEFCAVIGPNGAGKTTLFNVLAGVVRPTSGSVRLRGQVVHRASPAVMRHRGVGRTFQVARAFDSLTVAENVAVAAAGPRLLGPGRALRRYRADHEIAARVEELLTMAGLGEHAQALAGSLNIGDLRRLDIARALAGDPELLLLDEPAAGIGSDGMRGLGELISSLRNHQVAVLLVEHYVGFALSLCDRAVVLDMGEKIADGAPDEVRADPRVVQAYLGRSYSQDGESGDTAATDAVPSAAPIVASAAMTPAHAQDPAARTGPVAHAESAVGADSLSPVESLGRPPLLQIVDLQVAYGHVRAVRGVDLTVEAGEFVTVVGANGAGKTSLLKCVMGLVPGEGTVSYVGSDLLAAPAHRRADIGIGYVPEGRRVFPGLTVRENLRVTAGKHSTASGELMDSVFSAFPSLARRRDQMAGNLSGGEQQMLAMGRAMMLRPTLLIADEITLGLAPVVVDDLFDILLRMARSGTAVLLAEQNAAIALDAADRAYVMEVGTIEITGKAADLRRDPRIIEAYLQA